MFELLVILFLGIIATCMIVFPIIYLVQKHKQHRELIEVLRNKKAED